MAVTLMTGVVSIMASIRGKMEMRPPSGLACAPAKLGNLKRVMRSAGMAAIARRAWRRQKAIPDAPSSRPAHRHRLPAGVNPARRACGRPPAMQKRKPMQLGLNRLARHRPPHRRSR